MLWTISDQITHGTETTICAMITTARDAADAAEQFSKCFGGASAVDAVVSPGVDLSNEHVSGLFNAALLERIVETDGVAQGSLHAKLTVKF